MTDLWVFVGAAASLATVMGALTYQRLTDQADRDRRRRIFRLHFPLGLKRETGLAFIRSLVAMPASGGLDSGRDSVAFEVVGGSDGISHRLRLPRKGADEILAQLKAAVPGVVAEEVTERARVAVDLAAELRLVGTGRSLRTDQPVSTAAALLAAMLPLRRGEATVLQMVVTPTRRRLPVDPPANQRRGSKPAELGVLLQSVAGEAMNQRDWREKTAEPLFAVALRVGAAGRTAKGARSLVERLQAVLHVVQRPGATLECRAVPASLVVRRVRRAATPALPGMMINAAEVAVLLGWPVDGVMAPGVQLQRTRRLLPHDRLPTEGRVLGVSNVPGMTRPVALSAADSLHHLHAIGPTGTGKSTLLSNVIVQDVAAGRSVIVVDPKGDLVGDVADRIPKHRTEDVILLDITDKRPVGINLLAGSESAPDRVADEILGIFHRLYAAFWGPRSADILHAAVLSLAQTHGATLCDLPLLLTNERFRRRVVGQLDDPVALEGFWAWYEQLSPGERAAAIGPVMNKLRAFLLRRQLRACIGQAKPTWTMDEVLSDRRILLVSLARGELGSETAGLVGSLVVAKLWQAIQRRVRRAPAMVFIDEFQDVINGPTDLGEMLAQARGFGVGVCLAHQHLRQLDQATRAAVMANARTKVVFQAAADDAAPLAKQLGGGLGAVDLLNLPAREAFIAACVGGEVLPPASMRTVAPPASLGSAEAVRAASRQRYGRDRTEVEAALARRHGSEGADGDDGELGRRRRSA